MSNAPLESSPTPVDWRKLHALGWPAGTVRALLAVLIFATTWTLLLTRPTAEVPAYLRDLLFIVMGHYFASRSRPLDPNELPGPGPLYLPRGTIRLVLIGGSAAVAIVLHRRGVLTRPVEHPGVVTLLLVGGFLLGVALRAVGGLLIGRGHHAPRIVEDLKASVAMLAALTLSALVLNRLFLVFPPDQVDARLAALLHLRISPEQVLAAVVGFYFGSRS